MQKRQQSRRNYEPHEIVVATLVASSSWLPSLEGVGQGELQVAGSARATSARAGAHLQIITSTSSLIIVAAFGFLLHVVAAAAAKLRNLKPTCSCCCFLLLLLLLLLLEYASN